MNLALFDLDNTLLAGDSDFQWAQYLIEQRVLDPEVYEARNVEFYEQYKAGTLDIHEFLDFQLKTIIAPSQKPARCLAQRLHAEQDIADHYPRCAQAGGRAYACRRPVRHHHRHE